MPKLPCIEISPEIKESIDAFTKSNKKTISDTVRESLIQFFSVRTKNHDTEVILNKIIEKKFSIPSEIPVRCFYIFLYTLSIQYPNLSSKKFWGDIVYLQISDFTHKDIFNQIRIESKNYKK